MRRVGRGRKTPRDSAGHTPGTGDREREETRISWLVHARRSPSPHLPQKLLRIRGQGRWGCVWGSLQMCHGTLSFSGQLRSWNGHIHDNGLQGDEWQAILVGWFPSLFQSKKLKKQMGDWLDKVRSLERKLPAKPEHQGQHGRASSDARLEALALLGQARCPGKRPARWRQTPRTVAHRHSSLGRQRAGWLGAWHRVQGTWQGH